MQIITLASRKGGAGKTTLASHLPIVAPGPVAIMDRDPMANLTKWWEVRESDSPTMVKPGGSMADALQRARDAGFKTLFIDTPPLDDALVQEAISVADLVIIPVQPSPNDLRAVGMTIRMAEDAGKRFVFVLTRTKYNSKLNPVAVEMLQAHGPVCAQFLVDRQEYKEAMGSGLTAPEFRPKGPTVAEIAAIWNQARARMEKVAL